MKLSQIGELSLLELVRKRFKKKSRNILIGIGDDAAVVKPIRKNLLVTTDMMVEGVHFDLGYTTPYQLGFKLISINVSDIYAMGGSPLYILINIAVNKNVDIKFIDQLLDGIKDAQHQYSAILIGGDLSATNENIVLSATVFGYADRQIERSGAVIGDKIYVTGYLGDSACGLELLKRVKKPVSFTTKRTKKSTKSKAWGVKYTASISKTLKGLSWDTIEPLLRRHLMPEARCPENFRGVTSMIDVSDGLLIDLSRICDESRVGARIYREKIPLSTEIKHVASCLGIPAIQLALSGGEDYELLFTAPPQKRIRATHIGEIIGRGRFIVDSKGNEKPFSPKGYQHFS